MYKWKSSITLILILWMSVVSTTQAEIICTQDLNGDGASDAPGESATCLSKADGQLCPIGTASCVLNKPVCTLDPALPCSVTGECARSTACVDNSTVGTLIYIIPDAQQGTPIITPFTQITSMTLLELYKGPCEEGLTYGFNGNVAHVNPQFCIAKFSITGIYGNYQCPLTGMSYDDSGPCVTACAEKQACTVESYTCPLGDHPCMDNAGTMQCSPNVCTDLSVLPPEVVPTDTRMLIDDGARSVDGACLAEINIFAGRPMDCKVEGVGSAFQDCCSKGEEIIQDNISGFQEAELAVDAIAAIATASYEAYAAYSAYTAAGLTAEASSAGMLAFENAMIAAGPAMLYAAAAIVVINYIASACTQGDLETSTSDASGMCSYIGKRCTEKWAGECVQKVKMFCCFNTKLGRIIHEQGRAQLKTFASIPGGVFGTPEIPDCRGFKPDEFQALDFSQIDMSEYYSDLQNAAAETITINNTIQTNIEGKVNAIP